MSFDFLTRHCTPVLGPSFYSHCSGYCCHDSLGLLCLLVKVVDPNVIPCSIAFEGFQQMFFHGDCG